jgi:hypothetical protein
MMLTSTLFPTLPAEEMDETIQALIATNGGCFLPCWWGITPGVTSWDDANHFLLQFNPVITSSASPDMEFGSNTYGIMNYYISILDCCILTGSGHKSNGQSDGRRPLFGK